MNIKELKAFLADLPDDAWIDVIPPSGEAMLISHIEADFNGGIQIYIDIPENV